MNKLNGGYVMLKYNASQDKLKDAYDSGKPVIVYDSSNRGLWAKITESSGTYSIEPLIASSDIPEDPKVYLHHVTILIATPKNPAGIVMGSDMRIMMNFTNHSNVAMTISDIKTLMAGTDQGLPYTFAVSGEILFTGETSLFPINLFSFYSSGDRASFGYIDTSGLKNQSVRTNDTEITLIVDVIKEV